MARRPDQHRGQARCGLLPGPGAVGLSHAACGRGPTDLVDRGQHRVRRCGPRPTGRHLPGRRRPASGHRCLPGPGGASWATLGYSTGGFCAANLALRHADRYAAAASLSGYFTAAQDPGTARLYRHNTTALHHNSPTWLLAHVHLTGPPLFAMASGGDLYAVHQQRALLRAAHVGNPGFPLTGTLLPSGGHNYGTWRRALPAALDWLGAYLPRPSAPLLELPLAPGGGVALPAATHVTHSTHRTRRNAVRPPAMPPRTPDVPPSPTVSHYPRR